MRITKVFRTVIELDEDETAMLHDLLALLATKAEGYREYLSPKQTQFLTDVRFNLPRGR